jgi:hypothetical protein
MTEIKGPFGTLRIEVDEVDESTALGTDAFKTQSVPGLTEYRLNGKTIGPMDAASIAIGEVERLRRLVDKPLFAIWQQVEAETREQWFGEHDLREENRRLRGLLGRLEWAGTEWVGEGLPERVCPVCAAIRLGDGVQEPEAHDPGCWLAAELARNATDPPEAEQP